MKKFKKMMALVIAMVMVLGMALPAMASSDPENTLTDTYNLTINNVVKDHTYTAYEIFEGSRMVDATQPAYAAIDAAAAYTEGTVYYYKNGADYDVVPVANAEAFATAKGTYGTLYTRSGNSSLGETVWGKDITDAGKAALYTAYNMTVAAADINKVENIRTLIDKIADVDNTALSESDKATKFANVFFTTGTDGSVTVKEGLLNTPAAGQIIKATADGNITFENLPSGYYLINDAYTPKEGERIGIDYSIARIAVQVVGDTVINNKADKITVKKKLKTADELINEKANELGIGRAVNYQLEEEVPNYDGYNYYYFNIVDTMHAGLTFNPDSVVVTIDGTTLTKGTDYYLYYDTTKTADAAVLAANNNATFVIAFEDIMDYAVGKQILVDYSATVNSNAISGVDPTTNNVFVKYSNDNTKSEKGVPEYPGIPNSTEEHPMGETPKDWVDTYATKITITKEDGTTKEKLEGVEFTLTGTAKDVAVKAEEVYEVDPNGTYYLLKTGKYTEEKPTEATLTVTQGNSGWVEIVTGDTYAGNDIRVIDGKKYRPFVTQTDQDKTRYIIVESNKGDYTSTTTMYSKKVVNATADAVDSYVVSRSDKTAADGTLTFATLGAGTYKLSETEVLRGYNDIADIDFTIEATLPETGNGAEGVFNGTEKVTWKVTNVSEGATITYDATNGVFNITIDNNKGTELPATGGMGTTLFYLIGVVLVLGAGILLVTKRRMSAN